jgi:hypothetical protein
MRLSKAGLAALLAVACGKAHQPTWTEDVEPLVQQNCSGCHGANGIAPMTLDSFLKAKIHGSQMARAVANQRMPPWPPSVAGVPLKGSRALTQEQIDTIVKWVSSGMAEGPQSAHRDRAPTNVVEIRHDATVAMAQPYTPAEGVSDDYRCFVMDAHAATTRFITGYDIQPGQPGQVHHVILFEVLDQDGALQDLAALDGKDGRPGYTCFGGPMVGTTGGRNGALPPIRLVGGWAPGQGATRMPVHTGIELRAGSKLLMQVHYNELNGRAPDLTRARLELEDPSPAIRGALLVPIADDRFVIKPPPAPPIYSHSHAVTLPPIVPEVAISAVYPHMHLLGQSISVSVVRAGIETVLIDVPRWDFHWQGSYELQTPALVHPGDQLKVSCTWDNSPQNQPEVHGVRAPPHEVTWGEKTTDEMCLGFLYATF